MNTNICFSLLNKRTPFFLKVMSKITNANISAVLDDDPELNKYIKDLPSSYLVLSSECNSIISLPAGVSEEILSRLSEIFLRDRNMYQHHTLPDAVTVMFGWYINCCDFFDKNRVTHLVIEGTPAYELVAELAANSCGVKIISPFGAPVVPGFSLVGLDSEWRNVFLGEDVNCEYIGFIDNASNLGVKVRDYSVKASYINAITQKISQSKLYFSNRSLNFPSLRFVIENLIVRKTRILYKKIFKDILPSYKGSFDYVVYMHKEPEKSVSNCGAKFRTQLEALIEFRKCYPLAKIGLKPHPHAKGFQSLHDLKFLRSLGFYSADNMRPVDCVATNTKVISFSGSVLSEVVLLGGSAISFGDSYQCRAEGVKKMFAAPGSMVNSEQQLNLEQYRNYLGKAAFKFEVSDVVSRPEIMSDSNVANFISMLNEVCIYNEK